MQRSFETVARTSGNYTLTAADEYLGVGTREAPITITLPSRLDVLPGYSWFIKDESAQASTFPITIQAAGGEEIEGSSSYTMNVDGGFIEITNNSARFLVLGSHVSSVLGIDAGGTDAATAEEAVDNLGLDVKAPVTVASKGNVDLTAIPLTVNGVTLEVGDSVLLWQQTADVDNGIYEVVDPGAGSDGEWVRRADFDEGSEIRSGVRIQALEGGSYAGIYFQVLTNLPTIGTTAIEIAPLDDATFVYDPYGEPVLGYNYVAGAENFVRVESGTTNAAPVVRGYSDVNDHVSMQLAGKGFGKVFQLSTIEILDQVPNSTAGDVTYSANAILGGLQIRDPNGAARVDTIPSATTILAQIPQHFDNLSFTLKIRNEGTTGETITLAASTGITLVGDCIIQPDTTREFFFHITDTAIMGGTDAITVYDLYPVTGGGGGGGATELVDTSGNESITTTATASAVTHFNVTNAATGGTALLQVESSDTDSGMTIASKGNSTIALDSAGVKLNNAQDLQDANGYALIGFTQAAGLGVNNINVGNALMGSSPSITVEGLNTDIDLILSGKGTGSVKANGNIVTGLVETSYIVKDDPTTAAFFVASRAYEVVAISCVFAIAAGLAAAVQVTKDTATEAPGAGVDLLTNNTNTGFDLNATANTVQAGSLTGTGASLQLAAGDRLSIDVSGTATAVTGVAITVTLKAI
jgi:hypothetical protein